LYLVGIESPLVSESGRCQPGRLPELRGYAHPVRTHTPARV